MSKDLHPSILSFFRQRMAEHDNVQNLQDVSSDEHILFSIERVRQRDVITIWLSDAYLFTNADFYDRPNILRPGDYIIVAKPEGGYHFDRELTDRFNLGVGKIGKFMGALNRPQMWNHLTAQERERLGRGDGQLVGG